MPSNTLKKALKGDEINLLNMTYLIQHSNVLPEDIKAILTNTKSEHGRYLNACLAYFGAPGVPQDIDKAKRMAERLIDEDRSPHAKNLLAIIVSPGELKKSIKLFMDACHEGSFLALINWMGTQELTIKFMENYFKFIAPAYDALSKTYYKGLVDAYVKKVTEVLFTHTNDLFNDKEDAATAIIKNDTSPRFFGTPKPHKELAKGWLVLATYHEQTGHRYPMLFALHKAVDLYPKHQEKLLKALGENMKYEDVLNYINSILQIINISIKRVSSEKSIGRLNEVKQNMDIEMKNCSLLFNIYGASTKGTEFKKLNSIFLDCVLAHKGLEHRVNSKLGIQTPTSELEAAQSLKNG